MGDVTANPPGQTVGPAYRNGVNRRLAAIVSQQKDAGQPPAFRSIFPPVLKGL